jgi:hypothetical protein
MELVVSLSILFVIVVMNCLSDDDTVGGGVKTATNPSYWAQIKKNVPSCPCDHLLEDHRHRMSSRRVSVLLEWYLQYFTLTPIVLALCF